MNAIQNRHDFVLLISVEGARGKPVSDAAIKRKIRNYIDAQMGSWDGFKIHCRDAEAQNEQQAASTHWGYMAGDLSAKDAVQLLCTTFYDIRAFGGVLKNSDVTVAVRGPVQISMAEPVGHDAGGGYVYRVHGHINPSYARKTGFSDYDASVLYKALMNMGAVADQKNRLRALSLVQFKHRSALGSAHGNNILYGVVVTDSGDDTSEKYGLSVCNDVPKGIVVEKMEIARAA